ncbi:MAG: zinc dependent phospholipase C family protein [Oscillospiraceae bacterium]|nr:zinc dependent phospholipase C family protein [Oscillospiraceae bacterium]
MVFNVHIRMAKAAANEMRSANLRVGRKSFIFGNVFPDLLIPHIPKHRKLNSHRFFDRTHNKIMNRRRKNSMKIHMWDSFLLGMLAHYAADYSCAAHKRDWIGSHRAHIRHEKELSRHLKANPALLTDNSDTPKQKNPCRACQLGLNSTVTASEEIVDAMNAVRLVCAVA